MAGLNAWLDGLPLLHWLAFLAAVLAVSTAVGALLGRRLRQMQPPRFGSLENAHGTGDEWEVRTIRTASGRVITSRVQRRVAA